MALGDVIRARFMSKDDETGGEDEYKGGIGSVAVTPPVMGMFLDIGSNSYVLTSQYQSK